MTPELTPAQRAVAAALSLACFRAGVSPLDDSEAAARKVHAMIRAELAGVDVLHCELNAWLGRLSGVPHCWVLHERVFLPRPRELRLRTHGQSGGVPGEFVALPPPLRGAVRLFDTRGRSAA